MFRSGPILFDFQLFLPGDKKDLFSSRFPPVYRPPIILSVPRSPPVSSPPRYSA